MRAHWLSRFRLVTDLLLLLASGMLLGCGRAGVTFPSDGGVPPDGGEPAVECGPFGPSKLDRFPGGHLGETFVMADVNCDGLPDAVTAGWGGRSYDRTGDIHILLGNGDGRFRSGGTIEFGPGSRPDAVAIGDFNGDGAADIVASVSSLNVPHSRLLLFRGSCGTQPWSSVAVADPSPYRSNDMAAADMDGDGVDDLVVARKDAPRIAVLRGGTTPFQHVLVSDLAMASYIGGLTVGDFDGDGYRDVAAVSFGGST